MDRALLDTDTLSEVMRGKDPRVVANASDYIKTHGHLTISIAEVVKGFERLQREGEITRFALSVQGMEVLSLTADSAFVAGRVYGSLERNGLPIGRMDPLVAAIALVNGLQVVTGNVSHYERLQLLGFDLKIANWRQ